MDWMSLLRHTAAFVIGAGVFCLVCLYERRKASHIRENIPPHLLLRNVFTVLAGGVLAVLCLWRFGLTVRCGLCFAFSALLSAVALVDMDTLEISNGICAAIAVVGVACCILIPTPDWTSRLIGVFCVSAPLLLITKLVPDAFGGGDIKLMAACGLVLGWRENLLAAFAAILLGGLWGAVALLTKKKKPSEHFAFGPFLCIGAGMCAFFGDEIVKIFLKVFDLSQTL